MNATSLNSMPFPPAGCAAPSLEFLMGRVEALRARCRQREACQPDLPVFAAEGREIAPGLYLSERRFPLWYLKRRPARSRAQSDSTSLALSSEWAALKLLSLCPALLDDGSSRLFLAGVGRVDDGQFLLRQAFTTGPGSEPALLQWLEQELGQAGAVLCAHAASKALLLGTRRRHGRQLLLPWTWATTQRRRTTRLTAPALWRELRTEADVAAQVLRANREALLSLAREASGA